MEQLICAMFPSSEPVSTQSETCNNELLTFRFSFYPLFVNSLAAAQKMYYGMHNSVPLFLTETMSSYVFRY